MACVNILYVDYFVNWLCLLGLYYKPCGVVQCISARSDPLVALPAYHAVCTVCTMRLKLRLHYGVCVSAWMTLALTWIKSILLKFSASSSAYAFTWLLRDPSDCITFRSVYGVIEKANESHTRGKSDLGKSVIPDHGVGSLANFKGV